MNRFSFPRRILLIEIERRCRFADCAGRNRIGLTKQEAIEYVGFECVLCERWNDDALNYSDAPDWWDEIAAARH